MRVPVLSLCLPATRCCHFPYLPATSLCVCQEQLVRSNFCHFKVQDSAQFLPVHATFFQNGSPATGFLCTLKHNFSSFIAFPLLQFLCCGASDLVPLFHFLCCGSSVAVPLVSSVAVPLLRFLCCGASIVVPLLHFLCCGSSVAVVSLLHCLYYIFSVAVPLLRFLCCGSSVAMLLLWCLYCISSVAVPLLRFLCCGSSVAVPYCGDDAAYVL